MTPWCNGQYSDDNPWCAQYCPFGERCRGKE